jgi:hypothetical protein
MNFSLVLSLLGLVMDSWSTAIPPMLHTLISAFLEAMLEIF